MRNRLLTSALAGALTLGLASPSAAAGAGGGWQTVVGAQRVSEDTLFSPRGCQPHTEVEPDIAMDPNHPDVVVAVFQVGRCEGGAADVGYATSNDGGRTWAAGFMPLLTRVGGGPFERGDDPAVAFGPDGSVYVVEMGFNQGNCGSVVAVQRSDDHGLTFGRPVYAEKDCGPFNDKTWIAVDDFPGSPFFGRIYVAWLRLAAGEDIVLRHSDDRGSTWSPRVQVSPKNSGPEGAFPVVQPNGDLTVLYRKDDPFGPMVAQTSRDGGESFGTPVNVADVHPKEPKDLRTGLGIPSASVDPATGYLYVVWQDHRFSSDGTNDAVLSRSTDGGATWDPVLQVSPPDGGRVLDQFTPAVAAFGGFVHVSYFTRERSPGQFDRVFLNETTGAEPGLAFGPQLTLGPSGDLRFAAVSGRQRFLGDYLGLAANASSVHAVWCLPTPALPGPQHQAAYSGTVLR